MRTTGVFHFRMFEASPVMRKQPFEPAIAVLAPQTERRANVYILHQFPDQGFAKKLCDVSALLLCQVECVKDCRPAPKTTAIM